MLKVYGDRSRHRYSGGLPRFWLDPTLFSPLFQNCPGRKPWVLGLANPGGRQFPKASALSNYQLKGFSVERLMNFLTALDRDVDIVICRRPGTRRGGRIVVTAAYE
jgi:hypothetical protein